MHSNAWQVLSLDFVENGGTRHGLLIHRKLKPLLARLLWDLQPADYLLLVRRLLVPSRPIGLYTDKHHQLSNLFPKISYEAVHLGRCFSAQLLHCSQFRHSLVRNNSSFNFNQATDCLGNATIEIRLGQDPNNNSTNWWIHNRSSDKFGDAR